MSEVFFSQCRAQRQGPLSSKCFFLARAQMQVAGLPGSWEPSKHLTQLPLKQGSGVGRQWPLFPLDGARGSSLLAAPRRCSKQLFFRFLSRFHVAIKFVCSIMFLNVTQASASLSFALSQWVLRLEGWEAGRRKRGFFLTFPPHLHPPTLISMSFCHRRSQTKYRFAVTMTTAGAAPTNKLP